MLEEEASNLKKISLKILEIWIFKILPLRLEVIICKHEQFIYFFLLCFLFFCFYFSLCFYYVILNNIFLF